MGNSNSSCQRSRGEVDNVLHLTPRHRPLMQHVIAVSSCNVLAAPLCQSSSPTAADCIIDTSTSSGESSRLQPSTSRRFRAIADQYLSLDQVQSALQKEGLESCNLIVAVDFTKVIRNNIHA